MQVIGQADACICSEVHRHFFNRGSKSRNKVAVGEPAAGSFLDHPKNTLQQTGCRLLFRKGNHPKKTYSRSKEVNVESLKPFPRPKNVAAQKICALRFFFDHGSHNVSRWMTWLPISLKNAAKCDKWYQLQNHLITESLNANGTRVEAFLVNTEYAALSVVQINQKENLFLYTKIPLSAFFLFGGERRGGDRFCARLCGRNKRVKWIFLGAATRKGARGLSKNSWAFRFCLS